MTAKEAFERAVKAQAPKQPTWAERFALKRRAIDRAILAECERQIAAEEAARQASQKSAEAPISFSGPSARQEREEAQAAIARAFGRPLR